MAADNQYPDKNKFDESDSVASGNSNSNQKKKSSSGFSLKLPSSMRKTATRRELEAEIEKQIRAQDSDIPEKVLKELVHDVATHVKRDEAKDVLKNRFRFLLTSMFFIIIPIASILLGLLFSQFYEPKFEKISIQRDIQAAIQNGADVETLKVVFRTRSIPSESLAVLTHKHDYYSQTNTNLVDVLNDIKTNVLVQSGIIADREKTLVTRIDSILAEYGKVNPFDGLEESQKRDFINLAKKLPPENYAAISDDVSSLVVELKQKNSLVTKYLNSSDISLYVSIVALVLTIGLGFWQFRPKARKTQKELIQEALAEYNVKRQIEKQS